MPKIVTVGERARHHVDAHDEHQKQQQGRAAAEESPEDRGARRLRGTCPGSGRRSAIIPALTSLPPRFA